MLVRRKLLSPRALLAEESKASIAVTVSWMLTLLATSGALVAAGICLVLVRTLQLTPQTSQVLSIMPGLMTLISAVTGILCLALTIMVYRVRSDPPPISITFIAVVLGIFPLATLLIMTLRG
ncbi:hypothetical protein [Anatilimnocola aggregata]|nr:hypothetical protein [Anatilimnocola aggregata]